MRIILLHGLYMSGIAMHPLSKYLTELGYDTEIISYNSLSIKGENVFQAIDEVLDQTQTNILVGHSLGGLMIKHYLAARKPDISRISHVIAIGSPLQGAALIERVQQMGFGQMFGNATDFGLDKHEYEWQFPQKLGSIAGTVAVGFLPLFIGKSQPSDGTVTVEETKIVGMTDHIETRHSHTSLILSPQVAGQIDHFIRHEHFQR